MRRPSLKILKFPNEATSRAQGGAREAIVDAAQRLFLEGGFGAISMDTPQQVGSLEVAWVSMPAATHPRDQHPTGSQHQGFRNRRVAAG
jgi:hypothetical protein